MGCPAFIEMDLGHATVQVMQLYDLSLQATSLGENEVSMVLAMLAAKDRLNFITALPRFTEIGKSATVWKIADLSDISVVAGLLQDILLKNAHAIKVLKLEDTYLPYPPLPESPDLLNKMKSLIKLDISYSSGIRNFSFLASMNELQELIADFLLVPCDDVTENVPKAKKLKVLSLKNWLDLEARHIMSITKSLELRSLYVQHSPTFQRHEVQEILQKCPSLQTFHFTARIFYRRRKAWHKLLKVLYGHINFLPDTIRELEEQMSKRGTENNEGS